MNKAVFIDRDNTIIDDPGYISDPNGVKLLPGVELAIKSLAQAGFKNIVCTNQSGIARGMFTEDDLDKIHAELRRQLADKGARLDAIYYCPYHPQGTVDKYACESDMRKPKPGMLLKAASDRGLDLAECWMVGDSARDIEAGQRAGCRTIRVRIVSDAPQGSQQDDESVQADFTVRNLVEAARIIVREADRTDTWETPTPAAAIATAPPAVPTATQGTPPPATTPQAQEQTACPEPATASQTEPQPPTETDDAPSEDQKVRMEILTHVRRMSRNSEIEEFSFMKLAGGVMQLFALLALLVAVICILGNDVEKVSIATFWAIISVSLQTMALTFFTIQRNK